MLRDEQLWFLRESNMSRTLVRFAKISRFNVIFPPLRIEQVAFDYSNDLKVTLHSLGTIAGTFFSSLRFHTYGSLTQIDETSVVNEAVSLGRQKLSACIGEKTNGRGARMSTCNLT